MNRLFRLRNTTCALRRNFSRGEKVFFRDGREKRFKLGWSHMQERRPRSLQERWHRAMSMPGRVVNYEAIDNVGVKQQGDRDTEEWRMFFETTKMGEDAGDLKNMSPWHDIPLCFEKPDGGVIFSYVNEIPKGERAKMECNLKEQWNPLKQDIKKGKLRYFTYGDLPFNYGFLPQTWECPDTKSGMTGLGGDDDPIDVVELSEGPIDIGKVTNLKVLGLLGMIDEGETDWKVIGIDESNPQAANLNSIQDVNPATLATIIDWFKMYKTTDGKPENSFYKDGEFLGMKETFEVISECHHNWMNLLLGRQGKGEKYSLDSVMFRMLQAQKVTSTEKPPFIGTFHILNIEEKFPTREDVKKVDEPGFGEAKN